METKDITELEDIGRAHETFLELRPHLTSREVFVSQVLTQMKDGYRILGIWQGEQMVSGIGFRVLNTLYCGKMLYIDDLTTMSDYRGRGYATLLLKEVIGRAKEMACAEVHLDTGFTRHAAHRVYLKSGFELNCHHMTLRIK